MKQNKQKSILEEHCHWFCILAMLVNTGFNLDVKVESVLCDTKSRKNRR